ncbi:histidine kinase [Aeromonas allosaccharophila]|uniref:histidine kinase n=2 Tax=Aeromonas TaxID=642 RepID=A0A0T6UN68_9GAMM|nr:MULTISPECIES: ATP-binding protein [Aeromonas]KRW59173.1 histidine kinase [Aeromonas allosaccharophila]MBS4696860.1 PAS domain S-box protein [Aeromonas allosaccharophila]MCE9848609.1 ATP-binding protein [Aeromonas allosaccharophila]MEB8285772.1 ATP-binding protein [Aeromonas veronii]OKP44983.1 histidine kinase [Aeromonas allosaccharophila]
MSGLISKTAEAVGRNGLSYRLLSYILVCSTVLAMIITVLQLAWDYRKDVAVIEDSIGQIEASFLQPIAASLWNLDEEQVKVQIEGIMNLPNMQFVMVKEMLGNSEVPLLTQGTERESYDISREFNLTYQGEIVGKLFVAASLEQIYQRLIEKSVLIMVSQTIKTLVVSFCILIIIYYLVVRHLNRIASYAQKFNLDRLDMELELEGRPQPRKKPDELDTLVATLNQMRTRLRDELVARHQAAEQLQQERDFSATLINSANMVICCMEPDLTIASINPAAILLTGYHQQELLQHNWLDLFVSPTQREELNNILAAEGSLADQEVIMHDQQAHELVLQWTFVPFYDGPNLKYQIGFGYDITQLKKVEREIIQLNEQLEGKVEERTRSLSEANNQLGKAYDDLKQAQQTLVESEKMASLGSLVAGVAHEINTPIGISVTASSYLQERVADFKSHIDSKQLSRSYLNEFTVNLDESMQLLQSNLRRASELIASFKQVAVDQSSEARYNFSLADNLHQVVVSLGHKLKKSQCEVDIQCDPKLSIFSFPGSFTQIYSNLILNSINHGFDNWDKPKKITIKVEQQGEELFIDYSDNGRGIPPEILPRIFDPFVTSKRGQGGSGLGTHIIYNLVVQLLKGRISCASEPGNGAQFHIRLPIQHN